MKVKIQIDGTVYEVGQGKNLLETCLGLGIYIPHFCYHPAMGSVGACRLCAVKKFRNPADAKGKIVMSCMEPVTDGLIVSVNDPEAKTFRAAIIESLMTNHPHDCPVCDEGGECHLQDMTVMTGHNYRRFGFKKRTYENQDLGPFINHEMNRCIQCYRCVRFYTDYAGGSDFAVMGAHDHVYFGRHGEGTLESEFSGNLAEVCPTGVFTDKTLKSHYTRKWDLTNAPSVCVHCSTGCNTIAGERYGGLRRIMSRYNGSVNGYFLCDRGRFGYEFVNSEKRILNNARRISREKPLEEVRPESQSQLLSEVFGVRKHWIGMGSPRASLEANYALACLVGQENFYHGISAKDHALVAAAVSILSGGPSRSPSLKEMEKADAVLILGEDVTQTAPMAALAVRQASRNGDLETIARSGISVWNDYARREKAQELRNPVFIAASYPTKLDDLADQTYRAAPVDIARLGFAIASLLNAQSPPVEGLPEEDRKLAARIAEALGKANAPLIITGIHNGSVEMLQAASNIAGALSLNGKKPLLSILLPECNSMGLALLEGKPLEDASGATTPKGKPGLVILENDLYRRIHPDFVDALFEKCDPVIVLDHVMTETAMKADILLPVGTFAESEGTLVSSEGRAQRYYRVFPQGGPVMESWRQLRNILHLMGDRGESLWKDFDDLVADMTQRNPALSAIRGHMPGADFRLLNEKIRRQTIRYSGRTAILAGQNVSEPGRPSDPSSPLAFTMEGADEAPPSSLVPFYWVPGWNSCQSMNFYLDEPNGSMKGGDPGIRLMHPAEKSAVYFFTPVAARFSRKPGEWLVIPVHRIFGSEELSSLSPAVSQRTDAPFVFLNPEDIKVLGVKENEPVTLTLSEEHCNVTVKTELNIPSGMAGVSAGLPGMPYFDLPGWGTITTIKA